MVPEEEEEEEETPLFPVHGHIRCSFCMCDVHFYSLQHRPRPKNVENGSINFKRPYKKKSLCFTGGSLNLSSFL